MRVTLDIAVRRERGFVVVAVTGEIDISTVTRLRERLFQLADSGRPLIVDLEHVRFIDSAGLGALVGAYRRAAAYGGSLHAVCARPQTRKLPQHEALWPASTGQIIDRMIGSPSSRRRASPCGWMTCPGAAGRW